MKSTRAFLCAALLTALSLPALANSSQIARGKYLVAVIGCSGCHTPGGFTPKPDLRRYLAGSDVDFNVPGEGQFVPPNLTPDKATGIGEWTTSQIATAVTTGVLPDGRILSTAMPWPDFANLTRDDALAIAVFLKSIPAVVNRVPGPSAARPCVKHALECMTARLP